MQKGSFWEAVIVILAVLILMIALASIIHPRPPVVRAVRSGLLHSGPTSPQFGRVR